MLLAPANLIPNKPVSSCDTNEWSLLKDSLRSDSFPYGGGGSRVPNLYHWALIQKPCVGRGIATLHCPHRSSNSALFRIAWGSLFKHIAEPQSHESSFAFSNKFLGNTSAASRQPTFPSTRAFILFIFFPVRHSIGSVALSMNILPDPDPTNRTFTLFKAAFVPTVLTCPSQEGLHASLTVTTEKERVITPSPGKLQTILLGVARGWDTSCSWRISHSIGRHIPDTNVQLMDQGTYFLASDLTP